MSTDDQFDEWHFESALKRGVLQKLEDKISDTQFGFINGYSTRAALFVHACFIDLDLQDVRVIVNLYFL